MKRKVLLAVLVLFAVSHTINAQNVGVGTTAPIMKLHVVDTDSAVALLENSQPLATGRSSALYFKTGGYYTGAIKTIGTGTAYSRLGLFSYAGNANTLKEYLSIADDGNVGIGTIDPGFKLDVNGRMRLRYNTLGNSSAGIWLNKQDNTEAAFVGNLNDSVFGVYGSSTGWRFFFNHQNGNMGIGNANPKADLSFSNGVGKKISLYPGTNGDVGMGVYGNEFRLHSDYSGADITFGYDSYNAAFVERMRIKGTGQVCIGTNSPASGYLLSINGKVIAEEVRVQLKTAWPDYVFADTYQLPALHNVKNYIQANRHLPNIPAAAEVEKSGIAIGDMQKKMMEKIEELTLYVISLQEQVNSLKEELKEKK